MSFVVNVSLSFGTCRTRTRSWISSSIAMTQQNHSKSPCSGPPIHQICHLLSQTLTSNHLDCGDPIYIHIPYGCVLKFTLNYGVFTTKWFRFKPWQPVTAAGRLRCAFGELPLIPFPQDQIHRRQCVLLIEAVVWQCHLHHPPSISNFWLVVWWPFPVMGSLLNVVLTTWNIKRNHKMLVVLLHGVFSLSEMLMDSIP